ncbi:choice-of-anchor D domain-containing protein [Edaphobacter sp. 12200R-103]|uniref:choice-of-anchor D domain-containing protein n=1 Tax=Edaphobacter sp. 12200R-103 TaxID=2703788 RepID=UPI00138B3134|nr:choice-of-anchor D domain-containing protein [Edaphobacter sp. 12200R-103]QHS50604.1 choice-of-anchor D domain-containing protein [Edaphobacter sp. 12200R-103]
MTMTRLFCSLVLAAPVFSAQALMGAPIARQSADTQLLPLTFEENRGQAPDGVRFLSHSSDGEFLFTSRKVVLPCSAKGSPISLLLGNDASSLRAEEPTNGVANYYAGNDRTHWLQGIPLDRQIRYEQAAPGIDLVFHGRDGHLEYDLQVAPGADVEAMRLSLSGGASFHLEADGSATVQLANTNSTCQGLHFLAPIATQQIDGKTATVESHFTLDADGRLGFTASHYDRSRSLLIDPVVSYTKIIGASNGVEVSALQVDASGSVFLTGQTYASDYPVAGGGQGSTGQGGSEQIYVTKLDPTGTQILYSTYIPSPGFNTAEGIALDASGNAYVTGITGSSSFPTTSANLGTCTNSFCNTGFVAKFDGTGAMVYSTLIGTGQQLPRGITVDTDGNAYIAGNSSDNGLKTVNAFQPSYTGMVCTTCGGVFFAKLNPTGTDWVFSSYFFSPGQIGASAMATSITRDTQGNIYFGGNGTSVPLKGSFQDGTGGSFVAEFAPDGKTLLFSTLLGGDTFVADTLGQIQVGADGTIYLAGSQIAPDFPYTVEAYRHPIYSIGYAQSKQYLFASAINPSHTGYTWSTYLGEGFVNTTAMDTKGNFYIAGSFGLNSLPFKDAVAADSPGAGAFILGLTPKGDLVSSTGFGGRVISQVPNGMAIDPSGNIYIAGTANSLSINNGFPYGFYDPINVGTGTAYTDQARSGSYSSFIAKIAPTNQPQISLTYSGPMLELRNAGSADLHIVSIVPGNSITSIINACGTTVAAASSCFLTPLSTTRGGTLTINSDAQPSSQTFTPTGLASSLGAVVYVDSSQLNIPPTQNGTTSVAKPLYIWNLGNAGVAISSILTFGWTSQTNDCPAILAPGTFCTASVTVKPVSAGAPSGSYDIGVVYGSGSRVDVYPNFTPNPVDGPLLFSADRSLQYGNVQLGTTSLIRTVTITNSGTAPVTVDVPSFSGDGASSFTVAANTCAGIALASQASCVIGVSFEPLQAGRLAVPMLLSGGGSSTTIYVIGTGISTPSLSINPGSFDFGNVVPGTTATQTVQIKNTNATEIALTSITAGAADGGLQPDYSQTNDCGATLASNASCSITVTFGPSVLGMRKGAVTLMIDGGALTSKVLLTGTGVPAFLAAPNSLSFSSTPVGSKVSQSISLVNQSSMSLAPVLTTTAPFSIDSTTCNGPLAAGTSCLIFVGFQPDSNGPQAAVLTVASGEVNPITVPLSGTGTVSAITLSPTSLTFEGANIGTSAAAQTIALTNSGAAPLTALTFGISGVNPEDFKLTTTCGISLASQQSCLLNVVFTPSSAGAESATLFISSNAATGPATVALVGTGNSSGLALSTSSPSATISGGSSAPYTLVQQPRPGATGTITFTCADLPLYAACSFSPASLSIANGGSTTLTVTTSQTQTAARRQPINIEAAGCLASLFLLPVVRRRSWLTLLSCLLLFAFVGIGGCASSSKPSSLSSTNLTPKGTYTFHVIASAGTQMQTIPLTLTVQ